MRVCVRALFCSAGDFRVLSSLVKQWDFFCYFFGKCKKEHKNCVVKNLTGANRCRRSKDGNKKDGGSKRKQTQLEESSRMCALGSSVPRENGDVHVRRKRKGAANQ